MAAELRPGDELAGYRVRSVLGRGGMGVVYLAESPHGPLCALKVLSQARDPDPSFAVRFKREAEYAEALDHPHILELYDAGETPDGALYFAMQYVPGADLGVVLRRDGPLALADALLVLGQIADALDCAHARGLIHRDVKPGNIILAADRGAGAGSGPYAYLTDFGLSKNPAADSIALTRAGQFIGTTAYTAPEEILAQPRTHLVDVYSLGCVLYETLVGRPPFVAERDLDVLYAHIGDPRPKATDQRPDLPPEVDAVIAKAMAIAPAERYPTCMEMIADARGLLPGDATIPGPVAADAVLRLAVVGGLGLGREVLVERELELGRLATLDGALELDRAISRRHGRITRATDGAFLVEDDYSANGTFVNETRIEAPRRLLPGDQLRIGSTVFAVTFEAPAADYQAGSVLPVPPAVPDPPVVALDPPAAPAPPAAPGQRLALRLEVDIDAGDLVIAIEDGPTTRIIRDGDGWRVEAG